MEEEEKNTRQWNNINVFFISFFATGFIIITYKHPHDWNKYCLPSTTKKFNVFFVLVTVQINKRKSVNDRKLRPKSVVDAEERGPGR